MKTQWGYTDLANAYFERPEYAPKASKALSSITALSPDNKRCDMGAGAGYLTISTTANGYIVMAIKHNDAMRANVMKHTRGSIAPVQNRRTA